MTHDVKALAAHSKPSGAVSDKPTCYGPLEETALGSPSLCQDRKHCRPSANQNTAQDLLVLQWRVATVRPFCSPLEVVEQPSCRVGLAAPHGDRAAGATTGALQEPHGCRKCCQITPFRTLGVRLPSDTPAGSHSTLSPFAARNAGPVTAQR